MDDLSKREYSPTAVKNALAERYLAVKSEMSGAGSEAPTHDTVTEPYVRPMTADPYTSRGRQLASTPVFAVAATSPPEHVNTYAHPDPGTNAAFTSEFKKRGISPNSTLDGYGNLFKLKEMIDGAEGEEIRFQSRLG
jgi:hypothetical protein